MCAHNVKDIGVNKSSAVGVLAQILYVLFLRNQ